MDSAHTASRAAPATPPAARAVGWLAILLAIGSALMAVAHAGVRVPLFSALGPDGSAVIPPAVIAFTVATVLAAALAYGAFRLHAWAWALGVVVGALTTLSAAFPFRGVGSVVGIALGAAIVAALLSPGGRAALLPGR